jgi:hypothetical protein
VIGLLPLPRGRDRLVTTKSQPKLTPDQVIMIRQLARDGTCSQEAIGAWFGIHQTCVSLIHLGKIWKDVEE